MKPVLVIEQEIRLAGQGALGGRLAASGLPVRSLRTWEEGLDGLRAADFSGIVPLGSNASAWQEDEYPFLRPQRELLADAVEEGVPVLGICFGAQMLARALGGEVYAADGLEIGWCEIVPTGAAADDPVLGHATAPAGVSTFEEWLGNHPGYVETLGIDEAALRASVAREAETHEAVRFRTRLFDGFLGVVRRLAAER